MKKLLMIVLAVILAGLTPSLSAKSEQPSNSLSEQLQPLYSKLSPGKVLVLGETHGTNESPEIILLLVKESLNNFPKKNARIYLEYSCEEQSDINDYLTSDGSKEAQLKFLSTPFWNPKGIVSGLSSQAMFQLIESTRQLRQEGNLVEITAFDSHCTKNEEVDREMSMAANITASYKEDEVGILLVGNLHAALPTKMQKMASYLKMPFESVNLSFDAGTYWACNGPTIEHCGIKKSRNKNQTVRSGLAKDNDWYHYTFHFGRASVSYPMPTK